MKKPQIYNESNLLFQYLEKLIDQSRDVFWVRSSDYSGQLYVSPAYERIWGRPCESLYQHPERWIDAVLPEDQERVKKDIEKRDRNVIPGQKFLQHYRVIRPDGQIRWIEDESFAIFNNDGLHIGFAGIATDVTEKKENEIYLQKEKERAESVSKAKSEFIANMSHDIKTPLSGMIGMTDILRAHLKEKKEINYAENILRAGHVLMEFVDNCLGAVLSESSNITFIKEPFFLKSIFQDIFLLFQPAVKSKGLSFSVDYPDNAPDFFLGNRAAIYRILLNLVGNAIKFTTKGSVRLQAIISEKPTSTRQAIIKFLVEDTGIGISEDKQKIIFDRYTRLSPSYEGVYEGTGIGLSIVKKFVEELRGEIQVTSQKDKGSRFLVVLPLDIPLLHPEEYSEQNNELASSLIDKNPSSDTLAILQPNFLSDLKAMPDKIKILLVEDNILAQRIAESILGDLGYQVETADCGRKALDLFSQNKYDLAFIDIGLPDISGYVVIEEIKKIEKERTCSIPLIILTAHAIHDVEKNSSSLEIQEILSKPLSKDKARATIERYVINKAVHMVSALPAS